MPTLSDNLKVLYIFLSFGQGLAHYSLHVVPTFNYLCHIFITESQVDLLSGIYWSSICFYVNSVVVYRLMLRRRQQRCISMMIPSTMMMKLSQSSVLLPVLNKHGRHREEKGAWKETKDIECNNYQWICSLRLLYNNALLATNNALKCCTII